MGVLFVIIALASSRRSIETFAADGSIESPVLRGLLITARIALAASGAALILNRGRGLVAVIRSPALALGLSLVFALAFAEGLVRLVMGPVEAWAPAPIYVGEASNRASGTFLADSLTGWRMHPSSSFVWTIDGRDRPYEANDAGFRSPYSHAEFWQQTD